MTQSLGMLNGFTLLKLPSIYNNKTVLNEYTGSRLNSLIQHNIGIEFSDDNYQKTHKGFANEQAHLSTLISKYNKKEGCLKIKIKCPDHGWGRIQPEDHASLSVLHRPTRHSICHGTYIDIDIYSCCQTVFKNVAELNGTSYPFLNEYLENRDLIFNTFMRKYNVSRNQIKGLFTALSFGGCADAWFNKYKISNGNDPFILNLQQEYQQLMEIIYDANPQICNDILKYNPNKFIKYTEPNDLLKKRKRTTMASFYLTAERYLQETMIDYLVKTKSFNFKDIVPSQDGFMILEQLNYPGLVDECLLVVQNKFNFNLKLKIKDFDERFDIPPYVTDKDKLNILKEQHRIQKESEKERIRVQKESEKERIRVQKETENERIRVQKETDKQTRQETEELQKQLKDKKKKEEEPIDLGIDENEIDWNITEASFAKEFKKICFNNNVIFIGDKEKPDGFMYNGIYWQPIGLHNAELSKEHFDNLFKHYETALNNKDLNEKTFNKYKFQINQLNFFKTRSNVLKIFKTDNHKFNINWNKNNNLFVFNNSIYDLEKGEFSEPNPEDYINLSCGYDYIKPKNYNEISLKINNFIKSIIAESDYEYMMKVCSSFLYQENIDEKGYFWLGSGRNGKGTKTSLLKNTFGNYWGELSMSYYTTFDTKTDAPNQNLYNCRNSRILNSGELPNVNINNKPVMFVADKFKSITGRDSIYARELGTKNTAYFSAGTALIQLNNMPNFGKIDIAILERVVVIDFPYTFVDKDNIGLTENPEIYKLKDDKLKDMFNTNDYKCVFITELFKWYKEYKKEFIIPDNVKHHTAKYFNNCSIVSFIKETYTFDLTEKILISEIQKFYEEHSDKKMTNKQICDELIINKFEVKRIKGLNYLKNYHIPEVDTDK